MYNAAYNKTQLKYFRKKLRKNQTDAEAILWTKLRNKQLLGFKFYRQFSIDNYILDFYCPKAKLCIELDGSHHAENERAQLDVVRTINLNEKDIRILRFWNNDIKLRLFEVIETISRELGIY